MTVIKCCVVFVSAVWLLAFLVGFKREVSAAVGPVERVTTIWSWDTQAEFNECYRDRYLDSEQQPGTVRLARGIVVADEMGAAYNDYQPVRGKIQAKKILPIEDPRVEAATLLVGGHVKACDLLVNGRKLGTEPLEKSYWHADWERYVIPPELLRKGPNEFIFRAPSPDVAGSIRVERSQQPNRSAVSRDGGYSWDFDHLGKGGYINGELQVRLNLRRYAPQAWIQSPVMDLAAGLSPGQVPAARQARLSCLRVRHETPWDTSVEAWVRTGATPDGYEENWTRWYAWPREEEQITFQRFAQWRLTLRTRDARRTPVVHSVEAQVQAHGPSESDVGLVEEANQRIVRSSYRFAYGEYTGRLRVLRNHWKLEEVVAGIDSEFEKLKALRQWVRDQWTNGWSMGQLEYVPSWDARVILSLAPQNLCLGMCTHYATTYVQCSQALGYTSRSIFRGHALSETWSNQFGKWMVMDAGCDANDRRRATYHFEREGIPLNEMEVHQAYFIDQDWRNIRVEATNMSLGSEKPEEPFLTDPETIIGATRQMFLPLRNNFLEHREPEEPEHGMGYFKFLGHLFWKDETTPEVPWTDFFTTREEDLYWTLNQAQIFLLAPRPGERTVEVILDTVTPNFAGYECRINGGEWIEWRALPPSGPQTLPGLSAWPMRPDGTGGCIAFDWKLQPGRNTLEARPFNQAGIRGLTSRVTLQIERMSPTSGVGPRGSE